MLLAPPIRILSTTLPESANPDLLNSAVVVR